MIQYGRSPIPERIIRSLAEATKNTSEATTEKADTWRTTMGNPEIKVPHEGDNLLPT